MAQKLSAGFEGIGGSIGTVTKPPQSNQASNIKDVMKNNVYTMPEDAVENWYKQKPYCFRHVNRQGQVSEFYLPISPSNINIVTHFATNVISTMYGTVEEHSEQRYYDITIAGTTGMSPRYYDVVKDQIASDKVISDPLRDTKALKAPGRAGFQVKSILNTGGFAARTLARVTSSLNSAADLLGLSDKGKTGVDLKKTGYVAFHNFYRFLLAYKVDAAGQNGTGHRVGGHPLRFLNYKDNNEYDVSVQTFQLTRDASDPMLYNYNIVLRAYNLRAANSSRISLNVEDRAAALGLSGIQSIFSVMSNKARQAKNAAYSAVAAAKGIGG